MSASGCEFSHEEMPRSEGITSDKNRKFIVAYIVLVALPILALAGILNYGRRLHASLSVNGVWHFQTGSQERDFLRCVHADVFAGDGSMVISQAGRVLTLKIGTEPASVGIGSIDGNTITASLSPSQGAREDPGCGDGVVATLTGTVAPTDAPGVLIGVFAHQDNTSSAVVKFNAVRQVRKTATEKY